MYPAEAKPRLLQPLYDRLDFAALPIRGDNRVTAIAKRALQLARGYDSAMDPLSLVTDSSNPNAYPPTKLGRAFETWDKLSPSVRLTVRTIGALGLAVGGNAVTHLDIQIAKGLDYAAERVAPYVGELMYPEETTPPSNPGADVTDVQVVDPTQYQRLNTPFYEPQQSTS